MTERWVVDSSPLIALGKIGRLDLLTTLAAQVVVPEAVADEVQRFADPAGTFLASTPFAVEAVDPHPLVIPWGLGPGETAVLSLARRSESVAVLDDQAARRCAAALRIPTRGTVGIVLRARSRGLVPSVRSVLDALRAAGFYLSPELVDHALDLAGERERERP